MAQVKEKCVLCNATMVEGEGDNWDDLCPGCADAVSNMMDGNGDKPEEQHLSREDAIEAVKACRVAERESRSKKVVRWVYYSSTGATDVHAAENLEGGRLLRKYTNGQRVDIEGRKEILEGPNGMQIVLDPEQIFPDDPGNGTPRNIRWMKDGKEYGGSTLDCAVGTGEIDCYRNGFQRINAEHLKWLDAQQAYCDDWLDEQYDKIRKQKETGHEAR